jgi:hypothetical protein
VADIDKQGTDPVNAVIQPVQMVHFGRVQMCTHERIMPTLTNVRLARGVVWPMGMLMMSVVRVGVQMSYWLMALTCS